MKALFSLPHGVFSMSKTIEGIVETSDNLAIASLKDSSFFVNLSIRSSINSDKENLVRRIKTILEVFGFTCKTDNDYPGWTPNPNSKLLALCKKAYVDVQKKEPVVTAIHAGLECGLINSIVLDMDSISIGPMMKDIHSTNERLSISSTEKTYLCLKHLLEIIEN